MGMRIIMLTHFIVFKIGVREIYLSYTEGKSHSCPMSRYQEGARMKIIPAKYDFCIKELFEIEAVRRQFLCDVLEIPPESIRSTRIINSHLWRKYRSQKLGILDILIEMNDDTKIDVEMQVQNLPYWDKRQIFYISQIFTSNLRWGESYKRAKRCVAVGILDFNLNDRRECHSVYRLRDADGNEFSDLLEIHTIELRKELAGESALNDWVRLFNARTEEELDMIKTSNIGINRAIQALKEFSLSRRLREDLETRRRFKWDREVMDEYAREQGMEEGLAKGIGQGKTQGQERVNHLILLLSQHNRMDDIVKAAQDTKYQEKLFQEFKI